MYVPPCLIQPGVLVALVETTAALTAGAVLSTVTL